MSKKDFDHAGCQMSCCTHHCNEGRDCPARKTKHTCDELGVCQGTGDCGCTPSEQTSVPMEAGNVWLAAISVIAFIAIWAGLAGYFYGKFI